MMHLNQIYKIMIAMMILIIIGGGIFVLFDHQEGNVHARVPTTMVLYGLDQDTNVDVLYRTRDQIFESNKIVLLENSEEIISAPKHFLEMAQGGYAISVNFVGEQKNVQTVILSTQTGLKISGFTPGLPVRVTQNNKTIYRNIPTDWAGRLVLNIQEKRALFPLCLSWEDTNLCYLDNDSVKGGVS